MIFQRMISNVKKSNRKHNVYFHTDAAQAVGKIPLSVNDMKIDLMSISGHKVSILTNIIVSCEVD